MIFPGLGTKGEEAAPPPQYGHHYTGGLMSLALSKESRAVLTAADVEAAKLRHVYVAPEHVLLALAQSDDRNVQRILFECHADPARLIRSVLRLVERGPLAAAHIVHRPWTPGVVSAIQRATSEAARFGLDRVPPAMLLLGVVGLRNSTAAQAFWIAGDGVGEREVLEALRDLYVPLAREKSRKRRRLAAVGA